MSNVPAESSPRGAGPPPELTLRTAWENLYRPELATRASQRTLQAYEIAVRRFEKLMGDVPVAEISDDLLTLFRGRLADVVASVTVNKTWTHLRTILRRLSPRETGNPAGRGIIPQMPYMRLLPARPRLPRVATFDELNRLYRACWAAPWPRHPEIDAGAMWRMTIVCLYNLGLRSGDWFNLRWRDWDLAGEQLEFVQHKTQDAVCLPLNAVVLSHVRPLAGHGPIWSTNNKEMRAAWHVIRHVAKVERLTLHDLRRTCQSEFDALQLGLGDFMLGHRTPGVASSYRNFTRHAREAVDKLPQPEAFLAGSDS